MLELVPPSNGWAYLSSPASPDRLHESFGPEHCTTMSWVPFTSFSSQWDVLGMLFNDISDSGAIAQLHQLPPRYIIYNVSIFAQFSYSVCAILANIIILPELSSSIFNMQISAEVYRVITVYDYFNYFNYWGWTLLPMHLRCYHKKFSNWGNLLFNTTAAMPVTPWKPCFHVLSFEAFSEFLLSYWSTPTVLFITRPGFSAFCLPYKLSFLTLFSMQRMPCFIK